MFRSALVLFVVACVVLGGRTVMPWMCLERCGEDINNDLHELVSLGPKVIPRVSIEAYDLDWAATLKDNGFSKVGPTLHNAGILVEPMITTANILKLRDLWANPSKFINQAVAEAQAQKAWMVGYNVDFEPEGGQEPTEEDGRNFASFLDAFAAALHQAGFTLTVDIAAWSAVWDHSLLPKTRVDKFITMETYELGINGFTNSVAKYHDWYGSKIAIGLETLDSFTAEDMEARFNIIKKYSDIDFVGIWQAPMPYDWVPYIRDYVNS